MRKLPPFAFFAITGALIVAAHDEEAVIERRLENLLALDYPAWGLNPVGYHLTSALLHAANALLVFRLAAALLTAAAVWSVRVSTSSPFSSGSVAR